VIEVRGLTKRYGRVVAVDALSFDVRPGVVTGFLGPNGSGKSTTMRLMLGLDGADRGAVRIAGRRYRELGWPLREVGALLETRAFHPGRSAWDPRDGGKACRKHLREAAPAGLRNRQPARARSPALPAVLIDLCTQAVIY
jgi:ABC-type cobalamin/Fe3+-siderophores transport system ATPase subunit